MSKKSGTQTVKISNLKVHPDNPRQISEEKFALLKKSLEEFSDMTEVRPLVVNKDGEVIGGNMRMLAMKELGWKSVECFVVDWPKEKQREFIIKDNANFGSWDYDLLANEWEPVELENWGLDVWQEPEPEEAGQAPELTDEERKYVGKITAPNYEPREDEAPEVESLFDTSKTVELISKIEKSKAPIEVREFLKTAAHRHTVFNYENIAEYYCHADKDVQQLMEDSALVIVDFEKAIESGFVQMNEELIEIFKNDRDQDEKE